jgi:hypothetical protein
MVRYAGYFGGFMIISYFLQPLDSTGMGNDKPAENMGGGIDKGLTYCEVVTPQYRPNTMRIDGTKDEFHVI